MAYKDCIDAVRKAAGRDLSDDEVAAIYKAVQEGMRREQRRGLSRSEAARKAGKDLSDRMRLAIAIEKRSVAINALRWSELQTRRVIGQENEAIEAITTGFAGSLRRGRGDFANAGLSVDALGHAAVTRALGALIADLNEAGLLDAIRKRDPAFERNVAREMRRLDDPKAGSPTGDKNAEAAAKILSKHMEISRLEQNKAGAWIRKIDHYIGRQSHDRFKIRGDGSDAAFQKWRDLIEPRLAERTFDGMESAGERQSFLRKTWESRASGISDDAPGPEHLTGFKGVANLAKKVSQSRKLHFKSADAWMEYNAVYGKGTVLDAVISGIENGHRNAAAMRVLGTNPESMLDRLIKNWAADAADRGDYKQSDRIQSWAPKHKRILQRALYKYEAPVSDIGASWAQGLRNMMNFKLGGALLSSLNDTANIVATARHNGIGALESFSESVAGLLPADSTARRQAAYELGLMTENFVRSLHNRHMVVDGPPGALAQSVQTYMKLTGLPWWTEHMKESFGMLLTHNLARVSKVGFDKLDAKLQVTLRRYGIEAAEWDAIRSGAIENIDGKGYLFPSAVMDMADERVAHLSPQGAARAKQELSDKFSTYIVDQTREAMSEPTAGVRDFITGGSLAPGTFWGEAARFAMQFKSFPITFMMRSITRELFRSGVDVGGFATVVAGTTALGYLSATLKEIARGREPRKPEDPGDYAKLMFSAMAQGGGLGIYGDFLFGETNRFGYSLAGTLAGPAVSVVEDVIKAGGALREGDIKNAQSAIFDMAKQLPPLSLANLFYTRAAADYLIFWQVQEMMNPGYMARYERRMERENNQQFWLSPTRAVQ